LNELLNGLLGGLPSCGLSGLLGGLSGGFLSGLFGRFLNSLQNRGGQITPAERAKNFLGCLPSLNRLLQVQIGLFGRLSGLDSRRMRLRC